MRQNDQVCFVLIGYKAKNHSWGPKKSQDDSLESMRALL